MSDDEHGIPSRNLDSTSLRRVMLRLRSVAQSLHDAGDKAETVADDIVDAIQEDRQGLINADEGYKRVRDAQATLLAVASDLNLIQSLAVNHSNHFRDSR